MMLCKREKPSLVDGADWVHNKDVGMETKWDARSISSLPVQLTTFLLLLCVVALLVFVFYHFFFFFFFISL